MLLLESHSFTVIVDYWTNTVSRTVLATPGPIYYHTVYLKEFGGFIQCYISVYHIFSSSAEDLCGPSWRDRTGSAFSKRHFHTGYRKNAFPPNMLCSIVLVQILPWPELSSTDDAGLHIQLTRLHDVIVLLLPVPHTTHGAGPGLSIMTSLLRTPKVWVLTWLLRLVEDKIIL